MLRVLTLALVATLACASEAPVTPDSGANGTAAVGAIASKLLDNSLVKDNIQPFIATYIGTSICDALGKIETYIADLTELVHGVDYTELHSSVLAGTLAATTGLVAGGVLVCAPIIFGAEWLHYVLVILASIVGLVGSTMLLDTGGLFGVRLEILLTGTPKCLATIIIQLAAAYSFGTFVNDVRHIAFFGIGAACAGYGSWLVSETVVGILGSVELVTKFIPIDQITEHEIVIACGVLAIIGGIIFGRYHDALIDTALGLLGGALVAQGLITMALADVLDAETAAKFKVEEYYLFYVAGIAVVIEVLRAFITGARENATSAAAAAWHPRSKTPAGRASAAKVSPAAEKAKALSKATPSKAMH